MVNMHNVTFSYGENVILNDFSLIVNKGECVCLWGKSGCGKTTITRLILGLENDYTGEIIVPSKISCVFQEDRLIENKSVFGNLKAVLEPSQLTLAEELLKETNLYSVKKKRVHNLSGGMKRKLSIIRAIAFNGDLLILDEAFTGIDQENKNILAKIIKREFLEKGKTVIMITHILDDAKLLDAKIINIKGDG